MNEKQKQALEMLNRLMFENYYERMTKEEYYLLLEFVFPKPIQYIPYIQHDWTTTIKPPFNPSCTTDGKHYASITTVGNLVKDINDTPKEEE